MLHTGAELLTDKQNQRLNDLFDGDTHLEVEATWGVYQQMVTACFEVFQGTKIQNSRDQKPATSIRSLNPQNKTT